MSCLQLQIYFEIILHMKQPFVIAIPQETHRRMKMLAAMLGIKLKDLADAAMLEYLTKHEQAAIAKLQ